MMSDDFQLHKDLQRDGIELFEFPLCKLLLCNDSQYPWFIMVPKRQGVKDLYELDWQDQQQFLNESSALCEILMQVFNGDKMNVAALGNVTPQLHIHHVVRFTNDLAWPKPIWGVHSLQPYTAEALAALKATILPALQAIVVPNSDQRLD
ncbi:HIT domain-containing protein [Thalassotalea ponticola]|uniref:HIT domain-containing protein n=1 Tax=Thalassotalea ponticola TaxID=1523392 RepID=UPI0025B4DEA6|nr:HIT domain-containing protein [Thalassotalea ponticola]MDN3653146.1 HIT domain-containing protein [Thalassotalea ponticola]